MLTLASELTNSKQWVPVVRAGGRLVVQEDVSFAASPVASHLLTGTDDEQISATQTVHLFV